MQARYQTSKCKHCKATIFYGVTIPEEWVHPDGGAYCRDANGFTATPLHRAAPVLETEVL